ncbi:hypothetical protein [Allomuricauda sp. ARW1Y1]|jgi:hypothetical protein|uniref:hypothetical protein n=1 Tax=Allomuricauda sp. ARW1Y1 TaxID=2663843 RepID=UPI0015C79BB5|nr:hypothetical protein [Muricauda sp. ARW1Y1]NYJ27528.1 hypothetical protein [Muricauda sp. ARW1Y1]
MRRILTILIVILNIGGFYANSDPRPKKVKVYYTAPPVFQDSFWETHQAPDEWVETIVLTDEDILAFPTAKGGGRNAVGGWGGTIYHVTTLAETGPGSLVEAMYANGPRIVVFDVGGEIVWTQQRSIFFADPNITILGQTAPSPGITIRGAGIRSMASEVIIRFLRIRDTGEGDPIGVTNHETGQTVQNVIIDHVSLMWGADENFSVTGDSGGSSNAPTRNVTLQNSIIAESVGSPGYYGALIGLNVDNISILQNYWANLGNRIPEHTYGDASEFEFVNNVIYNYNRAVTTSFGPAIVESIGNIFKADSDYPPEQANHVYQLNGTENPNGTIGEGTMYQFDNVQIGTNPFNMMNSNWSSVNQSQRTLTSSYTPLPSSEVVNAVLNNVGPSTLFSDAVDERVINNYTNEDGVRDFTDIATVGGFPTISSTTHPSGYDTDNDGLSEAYETLNGGNINPNDKPSMFYIDGNKRIDQSGVSTNLKITHMYVFSADLAGDWDGFTTTQNPLNNWTPAKRRVQSNIISN